MPDEANKRKRYHLLVPFWYNAKITKHWVNHTSDTFTVANIEIITNITNITLYNEI